MNRGHEDDLDRRMRRAAHESLDAHRHSIERNHIESALEAANRPVGHVVSRAPRRRRAVAVIAAAAVVALIGSLVLVTGGSSGENVSEAPASGPVDDVATTPRPTRATESESTTSVVPATSLGETLAFDVDGAPLVGFEPADDRSDDDRSAFADVLRDYLIHGSELLGDSVAERERQLAEGGLRIHTTLDPNAQAAAESAREELPSNAGGIDASIVSLDTASGAVRAVVGAPKLRPDGRTVNMAITPRETGSAVGSFVLAAGIETGAQGGDVIDGRRGCRFPGETPGDSEFVIEAGVAGSITTIRNVTAQGLRCGMTRLSFIAGLDDVVDTTYRMAGSAYLDPGGSALDRPLLEPFASLAVGSNEMSPLDMATGMRTLANEGIHHAPYFVEYIDDVDGNRIYERRADGVRVLDRGTSLETIDILKGVIDYGTARRHALDDNRPAFGVTGTQSNNTNAWFVGATPQLTTAVWVGDPDAYTPMIAIPEFEADGVARVQGGTYPAQIWKAFTDSTHDGLPSLDWADPPPPQRPDARLALPGVDCLNPDPATDPSPANLPQQIEPIEPITTVDVFAAVVPCE